MFADYQSHATHFFHYLNKPKFHFTLNQYSGKDASQITGLTDSTLLQVISELVLTYPDFRLKNILPVG